MATKWSLLALTQEFCLRTGISIPAAVINTTDERVAQVRGILNEEMSELVTRGDWPQLHFVKTFNHSGGNAASDYLGFVFHPTDGPYLDPSFRYHYNWTLWDTTNEQLVRGPMTHVEWRNMLASGVNPTTSYNYKRSTTGLHIWPVPNPLNTVLFSIDLMMRQGIVNQAGTVFQDLFLADTDTTLLPGEIILAGLRWRWKAEKGLPYAEQKALYETLVQSALSTDTGARDIHMDCPQGDGPVPGVVVPLGVFVVP